MNLDKPEIINVHTCPDNCCIFKITPYKQIKWNQGDGWKPSSNRVTKAGSFIVDASTSKILLVQSRGQMWGPPKGTMQDDETYEECAIREVYEETGIILHPSQFLTNTIVKNKAIYYNVELKETEITPQNHIKDNDANGIGWFSVNCLDELIKLGKISVNQHCKILIKKFFRKSIGQ
jgi:8-oxo-dGTP pyrophosphatase MutT (NUDIX family)